MNKKISVHKDFGLFMIIIFFTLFLLSIILVKFYTNYAKELGLIDRPNARSSHTIPTPRGGGLVIITLWLVTAILGYFYGQISLKQLLYFLPVTFIIALISFLDDIFNLSAKLRLLLYFAAAFLLIIPLHLSIPLSLILSFLLVASLNIFNFMDGIDGIAGLQTINYFSVISILLFLNQDNGALFLTTTLIALTLGFLLWNKPPAKVFMGDVGSCSIGFLIAAFAIYLVANYKVSIISLVILHGTFLFDASLTLLRRALLGHPILKPHKLHAYQRAHYAGYSHKQIDIYIIIVNAFLAMLCLAINYNSQLEYIALALAIIVLTLSYLFVEKKAPLAYVYQNTMFKENHASN